ncbi:hypothetical protein OHA25_61005 (plasmid) [Nonomuraea sp. NBC_00507]|uniref:hypothetical protein n=1 Tax=Nonomuraea sp. NBC_00507 TaxID=2976002 RepID=UPI002E191277
MPNKTLSVRDDDLPLWERAERAAKSARTTVSGLVATALTTYLGHTDMISVPMYELFGDERQEAFVGRWLTDPQLPSDRDNDQYSGDERGRGPQFGHHGAPAEWRVGVAETGRGRVAVYLHHWNYDAAYPPELHVFDNIDQAVTALADDPRVPRDVLAIAADVVRPAGSHVVWRDI